MRVCFVLPNLRPSGGVSVAGAFARGLARDHGVNAEIIVTAPGSDSRGLDVPVRGLADARGERWDVAVATWWETAAALWELDASRRVTLLQSFEQRFYDRDAPFERLSAEATLALPVAFVAVSAWMRDLLLELRPAARCRVVRPGIDKQKFRGEAAARAPGLLRVLLEGQPSLPFKGVREALAAVAAMREPAYTTLVALDVDSVGDDVPVDRIVGGLDPAGMAELYRESDVLLKLSRVEGLGLAPVEAFHCGVPCVVTPYTGHAEYAIHGDNALVVGFDDVPGTAAALDLLARDGELLARLAAGALASADKWPSERESAAALHEVLVEVTKEEPLAGDERLLLRSHALNTALGRARLSRRGAAIEEALTSAEALVRQLSASRDECGELLERSRAELDRIKSSPAYRLASRAKRTLGRR